MKPPLAKAARKAGCAVLDRVVTADLLTNGGTVCGAAGFDIRTGDFHIIRAGRSSSPRAAPTASTATLPA